MTITPEMLADLRAELARWSDETPDQDADQHFRIQMFHQRLHAAQHGREDAVQWATDWHRTVKAEQGLLEQARQVAEVQAAKERKHASSSPFKATNPRYQAWLDTLETEAEARENHAFMGFIQARLNEFLHETGASQYVFDVAWHQAFTVHIRRHADANLSTRMTRAQLAAA